MLDSIFLVFSRRGPRAATRIAPVAIAFFSFTAPWAFADTMPAGLWEIRTTIELPDSGPNGKPKSGESRFVHCVSATGTKATATQPAAAGKQCDNTNLQKLTDKTKWSLRCSDGNSGEAEMHHNGKDAYTVVSTMTSAKGTTKFTTEGKKIAETCDRAVK